jgi:hypothetical protein
LTKLEEVSHLDFNRDGIIGDPGQSRIPEERIIHIHEDEVKDNGHFEQHRYTLPATESQMEELAIGILREDRPFAQREWIGSRRPFSDTEFRLLRNEMIRRGLLAPSSDKDSRQGFVLTVAGRKVLKEFLPSPTGK